MDLETGLQDLKSIDQDEVSECISEKVDDGVPQDQAVAICLSEAEEGSSEPENLEVTVQDTQRKDVLSQTILVPSQLLYSEKGTAELVAEMLGIEGTHTHEIGGTELFMPGESHDAFFEAVGEAGVQGLIEENETDTMTQDNNDEVEDGKSLENPNFTVGDYVRWQFAGGGAEGEVIERKAEVGDSMSAGGNTFTIEEDDGPLYKMQEYDDEEEEFTNNVIKFEDALNEVQRPEEAPETAPRNRGKSKEKQKKHVNFGVKGGDLELTREKDGDVMINVPIQATSEDRDGDIITDKGQESIIKQLETGTIPLVPNHGVGPGAATYDYKDIIGKFVGGEIVDGTTVARARLREGKEMADELQDLLEQDMPVGFSVGFIPTETEERGEGGMLVDDLDLMEVSAVGVPSNPDAVPQAMGGAVAAAKQAGLSKQDIMSNVEKAFEDELDTMSTEQNKEEGEGKETENQKMLTEDEVETVMDTVSDVMEQALTDLQAEMEAMIETGTEEDEMDEDEDMESDGGHMDEDEEEMGLDESDKTVSEDSSGRKIQGVDDSSVQDKDETESLYSEPEGSAWGTTVQ